MAVYKFSNPSLETGGTNLPDLEAEVLHCAAQIVLEIEHLTLQQLARCEQHPPLLGLINTMVFTHLPANLCLVAVPFATELWQAIALLLLRSLLSQMDVPTRTSYVMAVVTPP